MTTGRLTSIKDAKNITNPTPSTSKLPKQAETRTRNDTQMAFFSPFLPVSRNDTFWDVFDDYPFLNVQTPSGRTGGERQSNRANVTETETDYRVEIEVPGYQKNQINIEYGNEGRSLIIAGRRESSFEQNPDEESGGKNVTVEEVPEEGEETSAGKGESAAVAETKKDTTVGAPAPATKVWVRERTVGSFTRSFSLPAGLDLNKATAALDHGVLTVVIPKAAKHQPKRINIL